MELKKFAYQTGTLTAYVDQESLTLLTASTFQGKTGTKFTKQTGIKSSQALQLFEIDVYFQAEGSSCAFDASGNQEFTQRLITVGKMKINDEYCPKQLEAYWTQKALSKGSNYDAVAFESDWTTFLTEKINQRLEQMYWQSNTTTGSGDFAHFNGFVKIIADAKAAGLTVNGNPTAITSGTGITASNVIGIFDGMRVLLPAGLYGKPDVEFMCGWDTLNTLITALKNANLYHYDGVSGQSFQSGELDLPGSGIKIVAYHGLTGQNKIYLSRTSNFFIGCDLEGEEDQFEIRDNPITKTIMLDVHLKAGTQVAFPQEIVEFTLV